MNLQSKGEFSTRQEAAQLLAEAEALLRKGKGWGKRTKGHQRSFILLHRGEQELAKPRLECIVAGIDAEDARSCVAPRLGSVQREDMFHGADEHARRKFQSGCAAGLMTHLACGQDRVRRSLLHTYTDLDPEAAAGHQVPPFLLMQTMCFAMQSLVDKVSRLHCSLVMLLSVSPRQATSPSRRASCLHKVALQTSDRFNLTTCNLDLLAGSGHDHLSESKCKAGLGKKRRNAEKEISCAMRVALPAIVTGAAC